MREEAFVGLKPWNLLFEGKMGKKRVLEDVLEKRFGTTDPFFDEKEYTPACVLCAARSEDRGIIEPFLLRNYKYPISAMSKNEGLLRSSNAVSFTDSMAATSAHPLLFDRVETQINGGKFELADGSIFSNNPVLVAIDEATRLYPNRPIGVIISVGSSTNEDHHIYHAIDIARLNYPAIHFLRIAPHDVMSNYSPIETNPDRIRMMQDEVRIFMRQNETMIKLLEDTMKIIFQEEENCSAH